MTRISMTTILVLLACAACRKPPLPCSDCDEDDAADDMSDLPSLPDLPCDGADLMTDNLNCGSCGNECTLSLWDGRQVGPWDAGFCVDGQCGPVWTLCLGESSGHLTCAERCTALGGTCVSEGCAGYAGVLLDVNFDGTNCNLSINTPVATIDTCEEPIPWWLLGEYPREAMCCCRYE